MFALEVIFKDGATPSEMLFVRRPQGLIGASEYAHVVVEDMQKLGYQLRLVRDVGRRFATRAIKLVGDALIPPGIENTFDRDVDLDLGVVRMHVTALDLDLIARDAEPPDKAGVRVLRRACSSQGAVFPAVVVRGNPPMVLSFHADTPLYIGRSKQCGLRLDSADISGKHARIGYEAGEFWVEDLGSTNGTYVNRQQISGRTNFSAGVPVILGREITITGVTSEDQIVRVLDNETEQAAKPIVEGEKYPVLFSVSEFARPAKLVIGRGATIKIGRDPACEMWLGAPHVSRQHCSISCTEEGRLFVTDTSTNGTAYDRGLLTKGEVLEVGEQPRVLDFGGGLTVAICLSETQEKEFIYANGSPSTFSGIEAGPIIEDLSEGNDEPAVVTRSGSFYALQEPSMPEQFLVGAQRLWLNYRARPMIGKLLIALLVAAVSMLIFVIFILMLTVIFPGIR